MMRYLPHTQADIDEMLQAIGAASLDELFSMVPDSCRQQGELDLPPALSEWQLNAQMDKLAARMAVDPEYTVYLGAGSYQHHIPATIPYLLGRGEFSTAYTPYQPEMSQGTLQAIYEFQSLCCRLLGMEIATASHYDGATALAEALLIALKKTGKKTIAISKLIHPLHRLVINSYLRPVDCTLVELAWTGEGKTDHARIPESDLAAIVIQSPNFFGSIEELQLFSTLAKAAEALMIVSFTEPLAYGLLKTPGSQGADLVAGDGQSLGIPRAFGGPGLGILASTNSLMRTLPGRLVGQTLDQDGERGFVLTLATREQHIRREKATSNICSNNSLCAVAAAIYLASLGGSGLRQLALLNRNKAEYLKEGLRNSGWTIPFSGPTFNEFVVDFGADFDQQYQRLLDKKIVAGLPLRRFFPELGGQALLCVTETIAKEQLDQFIKEVGHG